MQNQQQVQQEQQRLQLEQEQRKQKLILGPRAHYERLKRAGMPTFDGTVDPLMASKWLEELEENFKILEIPDDVKSKFVPPFLIGDANQWWRGARPAYTQGERSMTWGVFKKAFLDHYFPVAIRLQKQNEFFDLIQTEGMSVVHYASRFNALGQFAPEIMASETLKLQRFESGLQRRIKDRLSSMPSKNYEESYTRCLHIESEIKKGDAEREKKRPRPILSQGQGSRPAGPPAAKRRPLPKTTPTVASYDKKKLCETCQRIHLGECRWKIGAFQVWKDRALYWGVPMMGQEAPRPATQPIMRQAEQKKPNARVFALTQHEAETANDVVTGTH